MTLDVTYLCRGYGYAHASRALKLSRELRRGQVACRLVTGGSGATFFKKHGQHFTNLGWRDRSDHGERTIRKVRRYLAKTRSEGDLVIADELFYVPAICGELGVASVFMACALTPPYHQLDRYIRNSDLLVLVPDWPELHRDIPSSLADRVVYVGPMVEQAECTRDEARQRLDLARFSEVMVVSFGAIHPAKYSAQRSILEQCLEYWRSTGTSDKRLVVLCGRDAARFYFRVDTGVPNVNWLDFTPEPTLLYRAADLTFALGGTTVVENIYNVTPTVAFVADHPLDTRRIELLAARGLLVQRPTCLGSHPTSLAEDVMRARSCSMAATEALRWGDPAVVAEVVLERFGFVPGVPAGTRASVDGIGREG